MNQKKYLSVRLMSRLPYTFALEYDAPGLNAEACVYMRVHYLYVTLRARRATLSSLVLNLRGGPDQKSRPSFEAPRSAQAANAASAVSAVSAASAVSTESAGA